MKIECLKIFTANISEQLSFYKNTLGLEVSHQSEQAFEVKVGFSVLQFVQHPRASPYHIAFHIPAHQEELAAEWIRKRIQVLQDNGKDIVDFPNWNARSVYFYDRDSNILEFISRRHCYSPSSKSFTAGSIVGISEIGLATEEVAPVYDFLSRHFNLKKFTEFGTSFCAVGDDQGLFILIDKNQKDWFPSSDRAYASEFEIRFITQGRNVGLSYKNERLDLL